VIGAALLVVALAAAACSSSSSDSSTNNSSNNSQAAGPSDTNAKVTIGSSVAPPTLDLTANAAAAIDEVMDYNVYQHLAQLNPKGKIVPVLATKWNVSSDGTTYTFTLRKGVKFTNGDPLTPKDVVFSINRVTSGKAKYPYGTLWKGLVTSAKAKGGDEVVVTLAKPDQEFLYTLAAYSNGVILDPPTVKTLAKKPVGTGPFKYQSFRQNYSVALARNENYWGDKAKVAGVTFRYFSSTSAENAALKSGQLDVIDNEPVPENLKSFKANPKFKVIAGPTSGKVQLTLNNAYGPLKKIKVRQAISHAIDKQSINQAAAGGYGKLIGSDSVPGDPWFMPKLAQLYKYSPAKAKKLLAKAGYPNGFSLKIDLPPYPYAKTGGPIIAAQLKKVGIKVKLNNIQWPRWLSQVYGKGNFQATIIDHAEARDISNYADAKYYWNYADTAKVAALLSAGDSSTSKSTWIAKYKQAETLIAKQAANVWLYNLPQLTVAKKEIVGLPNGSLSESFQIAHLQVGGTLPSSAASQGFTS
jgi:peptide/nickel transport system substrate-binding protein